MASKIQSHNKNQIPMPHLKSWMHERVLISRESRDSRIKRYSTQRKDSKILDYFVGKFFKYFHVENSTFRWAVYKIYMKLKFMWYRIYNRIEIDGLDKVPENGCIFLLNHVGDKDVILFLSSFQKPTGVFTAVGTGLTADILERYFNFVPRIGSGKEMIEKMVRTIWKKSRYFAMWPEGTFSRSGKVIQGFSGIIRVYSTLNAQRDLIPLQPVIMQNTDTYNHLEKIKPPKKIKLTFLDPYYFPREWLKQPEEGGKTPRELIDYSMMKIARPLGQDKLEQNWVLGRRRVKKSKHQNSW